MRRDCIQSWDAPPVFVIPGNHDARQPLRAVFRADGYLSADGHLHYAVEDYPLRLVALDTLVDGKHHGSLGPDQLAWLDATLAAQPERPTIILMHHPPFATGITYMDNYSVDDAAAFAGNRRLSLRRGARRGRLITNLRRRNHNAHNPIAGRYARSGNRHIGGRGECGRA
jgi:3',5'-cyclic AMP phosphodiesterase CpdA